MADKTPAHELADLFPVPRTVAIAGKSIEIKRCGMKQFGNIVSAYMPLYEATGGNFDTMGVFEDYPDEMTDIVAAATGLEREWVAGLDPLEKFDLANQWLDVNGQFFVLRLLPSMAMHMVAMTKLGGVGQTSSNASAKTDTPAPTTTRRSLRDISLAPSIEKKSA